MQTATALPQKHDGIEQALDILCDSPPKPRETVLQFVDRAFKGIKERKLRATVKQIVISEANKLGVRALDPAAALQLALANKAPEEVVLQ